jgi:hypothetical protein
LSSFELEKKDFLWYLESYNIILFILLFNKGNNSFYYNIYYLKNNINKKKIIILDKREEIRKIKVQQERDIEEICFSSCQNKKEI